MWAIQLPRLCFPIAHEKLEIKHPFFSPPSDWYRGHRLRRKSKKVSPGVQASIQSVLCGHLHNHLFLLQGIFPACYIHLKEATVEGSGWALLQSQCLLPLSWQQNGDKWLLFSLKLFPVLLINLFFFAKMFTKNHSGRLVGTMSTWCELLWATNMRISYFWHCPDLNRTILHDIFYILQWITPNFPKSFILTENPLGNFLLNPKKKNKWKKKNKIDYFFCTERVSIQIRSKLFDPHSVSVCNRSENTESLLTVPAGKRKQSFPLSCPWSRRSPPHCGNGPRYGGTCMW